MAQPSLDDADDKPLTPEQQALVSKLRRMALISGLIFGGGLLAVFSVILWRVVNKDRGADAPPAAEIRLPAPAGTTILSASLDGNRAALVVEDGTGARSLVIVDLQTGRETTRLRLVSGSTLGQ